VDEWERITQEPKRLVPLPREYTAGDAIDAFLDSKKQRFNSAQMARFRELCDALKLYFDKALPLLLLYQQEQPQYAALQKKHPGKSPCELYGVEHLLRLFVKLPSLLAQTAMTAVEITQVQVSVIA
jgi:mortality factor 4-like protein 1